MDFFGDAFAARTAYENALTLGTAHSALVANLILIAAYLDPQVSTATRVTLTGAVAAIDAKTFEVLSKKSFTGAEKLALYLYNIAWITAEIKALTSLHN